jgi:hypothetical protein
MKRQNLLKLAFTMLAMFVMTGAMAQWNITVRTNAGALANAPTLHLVTDGVVGGVLATGNGSGVINYTFVAAANYVIIKDAERVYITAPTPASDIEGNSYRLYSNSVETYYLQAAEETYQTLGKTFRLYVAPDPAYSPSWNIANNTGLNAATLWQWVIGGAAVTANTPADISSPIGQNYVLLNAAVVGTTTVSAQERFAAACASDITTVQTVNVVAAPTGAIMRGVDATATAAGFSVDAANRKYLKCAAAGSNVDLEVVVTELVPQHLANYSYRIMYRKFQIDDNEIEVGGPVASVQAVNYPLTGKNPVDTYTNGTDNTMLEAGIATTTVLDYILADTRTKIVYTLAKVNDGTVADAPAAVGTGLVSQVSHKSDFIGLLAAGNVTSYNFDADAANYTVTFIINRKPVTGPIYHIPNTWNAM